MLRFPHAVLESFIRSFSVIHELAVSTETAVMEKYLVRRWAELLPEAPVPGGADDDGVARMRLVLQAQTPDKQAGVLEAFRALPREDHALLSDEMARSGIAEQAFARAPQFRQVAGPAFLVYYSPAFLRNLSPHHSFAALRILAEVYRRARQLWRLTPTTDNAHTVTVRIDQLKELSLSDIMSAFAQGETWLLCRKNSLEAVVERHSHESMATLAQAAPPQKFAVCKFYRAEKEGGGSRTSCVSRAARSVSSGCSSSKPTVVESFASACSPIPQHHTPQALYNGAAASSGDRSPASEPLDADAAGRPGPSDAQKLSNQLAAVGGP